VLKLVITRKNGVLWKLIMRNKIDFKKLMNIRKQKNHTKQMAKEKPEFRINAVV
jgi:hypothetical protein